MHMKIHINMQEFGQVQKPKCPKPTQPMENVISCICMSMEGLNHLSSESNLHSPMMLLSMNNVWKELHLEFPNKQYSLQHPSLL